MGVDKLGGRVGATPQNRVGSRQPVFPRTVAVSMYGVLVNMIGDLPVSLLESVIEVAAFFVD